MCVRLSVEGPGKRLSNDTSQMMIDVYRLLSESRCSIVIYCFLEPQAEPEPITSRPEYMVTLNGAPTPYFDITPVMIKQMNFGERSEYIQVGKRLYSETVVD